MTATQASDVVSPADKCKDFDSLPGAADNITITICPRCTSPGDSSCIN